MSNISFNDAFNEYYKLKNKYDKKLRREAEKIAKTDDPDKNKIYENAKLCVKCKQKGGTIFTQKGNLLIAKCGASKPCSLNIQLERAIYKNITHELHNLNQMITIEKQNTILTKLDYLFTIQDDEKTKETFNKFKTNFIQLTNQYEKYITFYNNLINNNDDKIAFKELNTTLFSNVETIKNNISEFDKSRDLQYVKDSIDLYVNTLTPLVKRIRNLNYPINYIYTDDNDINYLVQNTYKYSDLDIKTKNTENKVIAFSL